MAIFTHRDEDGDEIEIIERTRDSLRVSVAADMNRPSNAYVSRDAALRLHAALGQWLFPTYSGAPDTTLLERMVRQAAQDAVSAVLPLAARPGAGHQTVIDPEPRDVGHPEPGPTWDDQLWNSPEPSGPVGPCREPALADVRLSDPCQACGYLWALHRAEPPVCGCIRTGAPIGEQCPDCAHWHRTDTRCMHPREVQVPRRLVGCECGHGWRVHSRWNDGECTADGCGCGNKPPRGIR